MKTETKANTGETFNGWPDWAAWNVALWLLNDERLHELARNAWRVSHCDELSAARLLTRWLPRSTPDGARYSVARVRGALRVLEFPIVRACGTPGCAPPQWCEQCEGEGRTN